MKGKIISLSKDTSGQWILTLNVSSEITAIFDELKDKELSIDIKKWRERRSNDANAYFHVLVDKIADKMHISKEQCKINMVFDYGTVMQDENGHMIGIKLQKGVDASRIYKYAKWYDTRIDKGVEFDCYKIYEHTHLLDTAEMARLIEGVCNDATDLGIEVATPAEKQRLLDLWEGR